VLDKYFCGDRASLGGRRVGTDPGAMLAFVLIKITGVDVK